LATTAATSQSIDPQPAKETPLAQSEAAATITATTMNQQQSLRRKNRSRDVDDDPVEHHGWEKDVDFPIAEIQRIKNKTQQLRRQRKHMNPHSSDDIFRETGFETGQFQSYHPHAPRNSNNNHNNITPSSSSITTTISSLAQSVRKRKDSLSEVLEDEHGNPTSCSSSSSIHRRRQRPSSQQQQQQQHSQRKVQQIQQRMIQEFHKPRESSSYAPTTKKVAPMDDPAETDVNTTDETEEEISGDGTTTTTSSEVEDLTLLHDLCGEASSEDDIAWRNALYLLSINPNLAKQTLPEYSLTVLHICCLSECPEFMIRSLLYVYPQAVTKKDVGGRLPLHFLCASAGCNNESILDLLVAEYPSSVRVRDVHGLTPLHILLRNTSTVITPRKIQILLGHYTQNNHRHRRSTSNPKKRILQRRRQHWNLNGREVEEWRQSTLQSPVVNLHRNEQNVADAIFSNHRVVDGASRHNHEDHFHAYPTDIQVSLRKLAQWKQKRDKQKENDEEESGVEVQLVIDPHQDEDDLPERDSNPNPAAISLQNRCFPIHMLVQRAIIDQSIIRVSGGSSRTVGVDDDNDDAEEENEGEQNRNENLDNALEKEEIRESFDQEVPSYSNSMTSSHQQPSVLHIPSVLRILASAYPEALVERDAMGLTPLLMVLIGADPTFPDFVQIIEILLGQCMPGYEPLPSWAADMPLANGMEFSDKNPAMVPVLETRQLPLHIVAEEMAFDFSIVRTLYDSYPGAIHVTDALGRTPLHLAISSYRRVPADIRVLDVLFSERVAQVSDDFGNLPIDLLLEKYSKTSLPMPYDQFPRTMGTSVDIDDKSWTIYQRFFSASVKGLLRPDRRDQMSSLLRRLRDLPPWLRTEACCLQCIRDLLTEEIASPWKCAWILLDGILLVTLITVFRLQMKQFVDQLLTGESLATWYTHAVYATAIFRFISQVVFAALAANLGEFQHLCLCNIWYWIDIWAMFLSIVTSVVLYGPTNEERLLVLGTASTCLLWLSLIGYLSNWWHGMAVFTGGFSKIAYHMICPVIVAGALIVCFAQCFYTLLQLDCAEAFGISVVCSVRDAYRIVYMLIRGEPLLDHTGVSTLSTEAVFLVASFVVIFAIFLLALLVTVLIAATRLDFDDIALHSYWQPKLAFILTSADFGESESKGKLGQHESFAGKQARIWDTMMNTLFGGEPIKGENWYTMPTKSKMFAWLISMVAVPVWLLVGFISMGVLWPPQVRIWIFRPHVTYNVRRPPSVKKDTATSKLSEVQNDILQMKQMTYERTYQIEYELQELKDMLFSAIQEQ
jgi:hypothetical protein